MTTPSKSYNISRPSSSSSSSPTRRHRLEARTTSLATTRSSSTLSHYQRRHMPPTLSSYNRSTIMPLLDIDLTMTEDSSSSLDDPSTISDPSYNYNQHSVCKRYEDEETCSTRSQTPKTIDLSPSFSSSNSSCLSKRMHNHAVCRDANSVMWMDVRYCGSHTCVACREPQYPKFLPIDPSTTFFKLSRPLAGTRWWERVDEDDFLAKLMRPMMEFLNGNACDMMDPLESAFRMQELTPPQHVEPRRHTPKLIPPSSFSALPPRCPRRRPPGAEHDGQQKFAKKK